MFGLWNELYRNRDERAYCIRQNLSFLFEGLNFNGERILTAEMLPWKLKGPFPVSCEYCFEYVIFPQPDGSLLVEGIERFPVQVVL